MHYELWRAGLAAPGYRPGFAALSWFLMDGAGGPNRQAVEIQVVHQHTVTRR